jgi:hypothetical protein
MGISQQQGVMTTHLMSTPRTGVYVPWRERRVTERAFFVSPEKTHRSILLQKHDSNEGVLISDFSNLILAHPNVFVKDASSAKSYFAQSLFPQNSLRRPSKRSTSPVTTAPHQARNRVRFVRSEAIRFPAPAHEKIGHLAYSILAT